MIKRTGTSNRIEIQFRTSNHLSRPDSFVKLFENLCLCLAQGNEYLGQICVCVLHREMNIWDKFVSAYVLHREMNIWDKFEIEI